MLGGRWDGTAKEGECTCAQAGGAMETGTLCRETGNRGDQKTHCLIFYKVASGMKLALFLPVQGMLP